LEETEAADSAAAAAEDDGAVTYEQLEDWKSAYRSMTKEHAYWVDPNNVEGAIPLELEGTLFRNGPGLFEIGGKKINQPFDGDGMICQLSFKDGRLHFRNKYVQTKGYVEEQKAGKALFKGAFSTGNPSGMLFQNPFDFDLKNVANTHVVHWGDKLFALWEGGLPHELDPKTLETVGESTWDGQIDGKEFAAHFRTVDGQSGKRFVNFGAAVAGLDADITFYEFDEAGKCLKKNKALLKGGAFGFYHDFLVTENYYVLFENPIQMDFKQLMTEYLMAKCGIAQCLKYDDTKPTKIHVIERSPPAGRRAQLKTFPTVPFFTFHHANGYETSDGKIVCDSVPWRCIDFNFNIDTLKPENYKGGQRSEAFRIELDMRRGTARRSQLMQRACEFPVINPAVAGKKHKHFYCLAAKADDPEMWGPAQVVMKVSTEDSKTNLTPTVVTDGWYAGRRVFPQEPVFVPRKNGTAEDDGWVVLAVYDAETLLTDVVVLDAQNLAAGPVAKIHLPHHIPPGLHGSWSDSYFGPVDIPASVVKPTIRSAADDTMLV